jgi:hypothetical protein
MGAKSVVNGEHNISTLTPASWLTFATGQQAAPSIVMAFGFKK